MTVDAHLHLWDRSRSPYGWLQPGLGVLTEDHLPDDIAEDLQQQGIGQVVLVQADDTIDDTESMIDFAADWPVVAGVVGWVRLDSPDVAAQQLEQWREHPVIKGVRHLVHDDPRDDFVDLPAVQESLRRVAAADLTLDLPDAWHGGFAHRIASLADRHPDLTIVIDHLGKPPHGSTDFPAWEAMLRDVAARPNTVAKLSGLADDHDHEVARELGSDAVDVTAERWRPAVEVALDAFGPERLMYGSDWPITRLGLGHAGTLTALRQLLAPLLPGERAAILSGTATRSYRLT